jgi:hypothetical protein
MRFRSTFFTWYTENTGDGPREEYTPGAAKAAAPIQVVPGTVDGRAQAAADILGYGLVKQATVLGFPQRYLSRVTPMQYPAGRAAGINPAGRPYLYASSLLQGQGLGVATTAGPGVDYPQYRWILTAEARPYRVREDLLVLAGDVSSPLFDFTDPNNCYPDEGWTLKNKGWDATRYVTRRVEPAGRLVTVPAGLLYFGADRTPLPRSFGFNEVVANVFYRWECVPLDAVPLQAITALLGGVDTQQFDCWAGTGLLFQSAQITQGPGPLGDIIATVDYAFYYNPKVSSRTGTPLGHNAALRTFDNGNILDYDRTCTANGASAPFRYFNGNVPVDFADLFRPDPPAV